MKNLQTDWTAHANEELAGLKPYRDEWFANSPDGKIMSTKQGGLHFHHNVAEEYEGADWVKVRAEMRPRNLDEWTNVQEGTTACFRLKFQVNHLPKTLYTQFTFFQIFSKDLDKPLVGMECIHPEQFEGYPDKAITFSMPDGRYKPTMYELLTENDLEVQVYFHRTQGKVEIKLNEMILMDFNSWVGNTLPGDQFIIPQFGIYCHGQKNARQRANQIATNDTSIQLTHIHTQVDVFTEVQDRPEPTVPEPGEKFKAGGIVQEIEVPAREFEIPTQLKEDYPRPDPIPLTGIAVKPNVSLNITIHPDTGEETLKTIFELMHKYGVI